MRIQNLMRGWRTGGIGEAVVDKRQKRVRQCRVSTDRAYAAGVKAAQRDQSRDSCNYSDPEKVTAWLSGYDSVPAELRRRPR